MKSQLKYAAAGLSCLVASAGAAAASISYQGPVIPGAAISVTGPNNTVNEVADEGKFIFNGTPLNAFCVELEQSSQFPNDYTAVAFAGSATTLQRLNTLFENFLTISRTTGAGTAAFQMAVWEVVYDTAAATLSGASGAFRINQEGTDATAFSLVTNWLSFVNAAAPGTQLWTFTRLANDTSQDLLTGTRATDPSTPAVDAAGTLAMLGIGVAALGWVQRRSRAPGNAAQA